MGLAASKAARMSGCVGGSGVKKPHRALVTEWLWLDQQQHDGTPKPRGFVILRYVGLEKEVPRRLKFEDTPDAGLRARQRATAQKWLPAAWKERLANMGYVRE